MCMRTEKGSARIVLFNFFFTLSMFAIRVFAIYSHDDSHLFFWFFTCFCCKAFFFALAVSTFSVFLFCMFFFFALRFSLFCVFLLTLPVFYWSTLLLFFSFCTVICSLLFYSLGLWNSRFSLSVTLGTRVYMDPFLCFKMCQGIQYGSQQ